MTIRIRKLYLGIALLTTAILVPAAAFANADFDDVPDGAFFDEATSWAKLHSITTGSPAGSRTFRPLDPVTRGESVVFLKRYNDNVVQPAIAAIPAGPAGIQGIQGIQGATGGLSTVTRVQADASMTAGQFFLTGASCPTGDTVVSGGYSTNGNADVIIKWTYPIVGGSPDSWTVGGTAGATGVTITSYVTCAS